MGFCRQIYAFIPQHKTAWSWKVAKTHSLNQLFHTCIHRYEELLCKFSITLIVIRIKNNVIGKARSKRISVNHCIRDKIIIKSYSRSIWKNFGNRDTRENSPLPHKIMDFARIITSFNPNNIYSGNLFYFGGDLPGFSALGLCLFFKS